MFYPLVVSTTKKILQETSMLIKKYSYIQLHFYSNDAIDISERLAHWTHVDLKIQATYNVINGSDIKLVRNNLGYLLVTDDHLTKTLDDDIYFKYLEPDLSELYALVWKKATFSRAARAFYEQIKEK